MRKINLKKVMTMCMSVLLTISAMCIPALAEENNEPTIGDIVEYHYIVREEIDGEIITRECTGEEKIQNMQEDNKTPGVEFSVGPYNYVVTDDYEIKYIGKEEFYTENKLQDSILRGNNIPTTRHSLPYNGEYDYVNYVYTNYYFIKGNSGGANQSISIDITATNHQEIKVKIMDGRNNEAMSVHGTYWLSPGGSNELATIKDWVYSGEKFYLRFENPAGVQATGYFNIK